MKIKNKVAIVTGGANGIGRNLVLKLIQKGATVGVFDIDKNGLNSLQKESNKIVGVICDLTDNQKVTQSVNLFFKKYKTIDILVNNAGLIFSSPLISFSGGKLKKHNIKDWHKVINTNLNSVFYMTSNVTEKMILTRTKGVIINISSISAAGNAGQGAYSAAKAGLNALTASWSKELGIMGIRVVSIAPGFTETETTLKAMSANKITEWKTKTPVRRLGKTDEISEGIISVITNDFINGKVFEIDGGLII